MRFCHFEHVDRSQRGLDTRSMHRDIRCNHGYSRMDFREYSDLRQALVAGMDRSYLCHCRWLAPLFPYLRRVQAHNTVVLVVTIAAGIQDRPALAPQTGPWVPDYKVVASPSFRDAISSISSLIFAYAGTPTYFPIAAEMRDQREFLKALIVAQTGTTLLYVVIGIVVYYY